MGKPQLKGNRSGRNVKNAYLLLVGMVSACGAKSNLELPLPSGDYVFLHRFAEHPEMASIELTAQIRGRHIVLVNNDGTDIFPRGVIEEGILMWHSSSAQWIIGTNPADTEAPEVGGCSEGPAVVDLQRRIYWTC
jgi:hypothetical protein